jgi:5-methylthioribose kinase
VPTAQVQERLRYEAESLREMHRHCPDHVPEVYDYDTRMFTIVLQFLAPPHVVLRTGLIQGAVYPQLAACAAEHMACCLFRTSALKLGPSQFRAMANKYSNPAMCELTEQVCSSWPRCTLCGQGAARRGGGELHDKSDQREGAL